MKMILLVVEGRPEVRRRIVTTLDFPDFDLHEAEDGLRGLYLARGLGPQLVVLGEGLPGEPDGGEICARIKEDAALAYTRVLRLTAEGGDADAKADACLCEPFSTRDLIDAVGRLLPRHEGEG